MGYVAVPVLLVPELLKKVSMLQQALRHNHSREAKELLYSQP
jgi:hypothetical protein